MEIKKLFFMCTLIAFIQVIWDLEYIYTRSGVSGFWQICGNYARYFSCWHATVVWHPLRWYSCWNPRVPQHIPLLPASLPPCPVAPFSIAVHGVCVSSHNLCLAATATIYVRMPQGWWAEGGLWWRGVPAGTVPHCKQCPKHSLTHTVR